MTDTENRSEREQLYDRFKGYLDEFLGAQYLGRNAESLARNDLSEHVRFPEVPLIVERMKRISEYLRGKLDEKLILIPDNRIGTLVSRTNEAKEALRNILEWNGEENPRDGNEDNKAACLRKKTALLKRLRDTEENLFESFVPVITYNLDSKTSSQQILKDLAGIKEKAATDLDRIDSILSAALESSKDIGLSEYATIFRDEAKRHEMFGKIWLGTSVFLFLVVAGFTVAALRYSIEHRFELQTLKEVWPIYIPFFFLFLLLTTAHRLSL